MEEQRSAGLGSDDVRAVATWSYELLNPLSDADWGRLAAGLEWSCRQTLQHLLNAFDRYSIQLANASPEPAARSAHEYPDLSVRELLSLLPSRAGVLTAIVAASPPTARGFHPFGLTDPPGYIAMAIVETVVHTDDIARGLGLTIQPPEALCQSSLARLCPWAPTDVDPWSALRWATGRIDLPGHARTPPNWAWQVAPISEWDGTVKTRG